MLYLSGMFVIKIYGNIVFDYEVKVTVYYVKHAMKQYFIYLPRSMVKYKMYKFIA